MKYGDGAEVSKVKIYLGRPDLSRKRELWGGPNSKHLDFEHRTLFRSDYSGPHGHYAMTKPLHEIWGRQCTPGNYFTFESF